MQQLVKAIQFSSQTEDRYRQNPSALANIVNMALFLHTNKLDYEQAWANHLWLLAVFLTDVQAQQLYQQAYEMGRKHPITLYGFALLKFAKLDYPQRKTWNEAYRMLLTARQMDPDGSKFVVAGTCQFFSRSIQALKTSSTEESFFHWGVIVNPNSAQARSNYALVQLYFKRNYDRAEVLFRQAKSLDKTDERIEYNYKQLLDNRLPGKLFEEAGPSLGVRRRVVLHDDSPDLEWHIWKDPDAVDESVKYCWYERCGWLLSRLCSLCAPQVLPVR